MKKLKLCCGILDCETRESSRGRKQDRIEEEEEMRSRANSLEEERRSRTNSLQFSCAELEKITEEVMRRQRVSDPGPTSWEVALTE